MIEDDVKIATAVRRGLEAEGYTVNEVEWWHFDYRDWPKYPLLNAAFEALAAPR